MLSSKPVTLSKKGIKELYRHNSHVYNLDLCSCIPQKIGRAIWRLFWDRFFNLAEELGVTWQGLRKKLNEWFKIDADNRLFIPALKAKLHT